MAPFMRPRVLLQHNTLECIVTFEHCVAGLECDINDNQSEGTDGRGRVVV